MESTQPDVSIEVAPATSEVKKRGRPPKLDENGQPMSKSERRKRLKQKNIEADPFGLVGRPDTSTIPLPAPPAALPTPPAAIPVKRKLSDLMPLDALAGQLYAISGTIMANVGKKRYGDDARLLAFTSDEIDTLKPLTADFLRSVDVNATPAQILAFALVAIMTSKIAACEMARQ